MSYDIVLLPGDGIGPEVIEATVRVLEAVGLKAQWHSALAGNRAIEKFGNPLPEETLKLIEKYKIVLKAPITTPIGKGFSSVNVQLRQSFNLYANLRPIRSLPGISCKYPNLNLIIVRENTEDLYAGIEREVSPGVMESIKRITQPASLRIAEFAFALAKREKRKEVCVVHKANIMKLTDGLFIRCAAEVAARYPEIQHREIIVDNACMQLVMNPHQFDVLLLENLYGDIISDLCAGLIGGLGVVPGANLGEKVAIFEAVHGSAPDIAGKNLANPIALILSAVMLLRHLGETQKAIQVEKAIDQVCQAAQYLTRDLGGKAGTRELTDAIIAVL